MILCGGDALIDFVPMAMRDETGFVPRVGGAMLNVATALARLGEPVEFVGGISFDLFGEMLMSHMKAEGIGTKLIRRTREDSTLAFVALDEGDARYAFIDAGSARENWSGDANGIAAKALQFGSLSFITEPASSAWVKYAEEAREKMVLAFDPNCRPTLVRDPKSYRKLIKHLASRSHIVRFSEEDFEFIFPLENEQDVAEQLLDQGVSIVTISRAGDGATAFWAQGRVDVEARPVAVIDSIGAGDTFDAALLAHFAETGHLSEKGLAKLGKADLTNAMQFASVAASLNCEESGCNPPSREAIAMAMMDEAPLAH